MGQLKVINYTGIKAFFRDTPTVYRNEMNIFLNWIDNNGGLIHADKIRAFYDEQKTLKVAGTIKAETFNKRIKAVRKAINNLLVCGNFSDIERGFFALELQYLKLDKITVEKKRDFALTEQEYFTLIGRVSIEDLNLALLMELLWISGLRISEALSITRSNIKKINDTYSSIQVLGKGDKNRYIKIPNSLLDQIDHVFSGNDLLFEDNNTIIQCGKYKGQQLKHKVRTREAISRAIARAGKRYLDKKISAHSFRHSFAVIALEKSKDISAVSTYLGHSNLEITRAYYLNDDLKPEFFPQAMLSNNPLV